MSADAPELVYEDDWVRLWCGDGRRWLEDMDCAHQSADAIITDPPYGETSLSWDETVDGWLYPMVADQMWCFGSWRFFMRQQAAFDDAQWKFAQEVVWEKHTGSGIANDRFRRVHEFATHWYRGAWGDLHRDVPTTMVYGSLAKNRATQGNVHAPHLGKQAGLSHWESDGERLMRSVIQCRSEHLRAVHPTQKPLGIIRPLIHYSVERGGLVLDPFAGSGSTLLAAREMGRRAEGCEISPEYCEVAIKRLSSMQLEVA